MTPEQNITLYDALGGAETIQRLVDAFYPRVAVHPDLKDSFPDDLTEVRHKQYMFLTQYFGGPTLYSNVHGHPMMKMRHMPFMIDPVRRDAWLQCMREAMDEIGLSGIAREQAYARLSMTANYMMNTDEEV